MIAPVHLEMALRWAIVGIPDDRSTVAFVATVIAELLDDRAALLATIDQLIAAVPPYVPHCEECGNTMGVYHDPDGTSGYVCTNASGCDLAADLTAVGE